MTRTIFTALASIALLSVAAGPAVAAPCHDAKGKFVKCPPAKTTAKRCKDAKGKFAKCGSPGAKPV